jgi:hypothetical protein
MLNLYFLLVYFRLPQDVLERVLTGTQQMNDESSGTITEATDI